MGIPEPKVALDEACSTIYNNTLYSYSSKAFQSLRIEQGAEWDVLDSGVSVSGGQCVHATPPDNNTVEALYIVGGTSENTTYPGLQRYIFSEAKWETVVPDVMVTQNRLYHSAVYLNSSASILVYAGSQDGTKGDSSQTFTISTADGHEVVSYISAAPPTISPLLLPWTDDSAIVVGGSDTNTEVMQFSMASSWVNSNVTLASPLTKNSSMVQAIITKGDDGSKSLYTFDMSVSPNQVNRTVLLNAGGEPVSNAVSISRRINEPERYAERAAETVKTSALTVSDWPTYNSTFAPTTTRSSYSIAQDASGLVVISGGNTDDSLCLFSATENAWLNTTSEFTLATKTQNPLTTSSSTPVASTTSAESTATAAAISSTSSSKTDSPVKVLGAVLGSIVGTALLLIAILVFLRWRRKKREHAELGHQRRASGISSDEKDPTEVRHNYSTSFLDLDQSRGFQGHRAGQESHGSFSSMAILMGKVGQGTSHKRGIGRGNGSNASSASSMFNKKYKNAISNPIPQENGLGAMNGGLPGSLVKEVSFESEASGQPGPAARTRASNSGRRGSTRRSSGWNRYWSGGSGAMNILGLGSKRNTGGSIASDRSSVSQYSSQKHPSQLTQISALVPPLHTTNLGLSRVTTGSPTVSHTSSNFPFKEGMSGEIGHSRPGSVSSEDSFDGRRRTDAFSSGIPESVTEFGAALSSWDTPLPTHPRAPSSAYSASNYDRTTMGTNFNVGGVPSYNPTMARFPTPPTGRPPPYGSGDQWHPGHRMQTSDMSWLNLGADSTREPRSGI